MERKETRVAKKVVTKLVCNWCGADWKAPGTPAICPACRQSSFAIVVESK
jgi:rubrerythrin